jgi:KDO2-lipid IV(A) lauroyltransferase
MLHLAYPNEKDDARLLKLARQGSANLFKVSIDMVLATRRLAKGNFEERVDMSELRDSGLAAPWIGVSGHLGGWEGGSIGVSFTGYDAHVTARVINNPLLTQWLLETRKKAGLQVHDRRGGIRDVASALERGGVLVQAIDQHQRKRGIQAPWFGRMASCERAAATLAVRRGYPLMVAASIRIGTGFRFKWVIQEIIRPQSTGDHAVDIQHTVEKVNLSLEALIRRYPEQYLWIHNRYRSAQPA